MYLHIRSGLPTSNLYVIKMRKIPAPKAYGINKAHIYVYVGMYVYLMSSSCTYIGAAAALTGAAVACFVADDEICLWILL